MMTELGEEQTRELYGERLHIASLGVVQEKDKIRVVHDRSFGVQINHRIRTQN